jgi:hypothetical protein|uniref:Uncharacterized protein n=1 Tax=viral metagenome TaxID=1070528 RepID=A0A6C0D516_9ZZZZ
MTSTRNKNSQLNYNLEKSCKEKLLREKLYLHSSSGRPTSECIPCIGYTPSHISRDALANNAIDIESQLRGIGSTNLETPCEIVAPSLRTLDFKEFFERQPYVVMPYPMIYETNQRPKL